ncbi:MAG: hypothetical protein ACOCQ7_01975 [Natronomonas sp.]
MSELTSLRLARGSARKQERVNVRLWVEVDIRGDRSVCSMSVGNQVTPSRDSCVGGSAE